MLFVHKVTANTELVNIEQMLLGLRSWKLLIVTFLSNDQLFHDYKIIMIIKPQHVCFSFKDSLFNIYCWFINLELTANSIVTHAWIKLV